VLDSLKNCGIPREFKKEKKRKKIDLGLGSIPGLDGNFIF
jgi:hypothetical protein